MTYYMCFRQTFIMGSDVPFMRYNLLKIMSPLYDLQMSTKIKGLDVNLKIIYDFVYVLHRHIGHSMHRF